jgi:hypothetical protein
VPSILRTFRMTPSECAVITAAATALRLSRSELVQNAIVATGHRLHIYAGAPVIPPPRSRVWQDAPGRREESCTKRTSFTFSVVTYGILHLISEHVGLSESRVAAGATYRYVAELQKHPLTVSVKLAQAARPNFKALAAIELPERYFK